MLPARIGIAVFIAAFIISAVIPRLSHSQEEKESPIKYVRGKICDIDWAGSRITIQWFYSTDKLAQDKMVFTMPRDVKVSTDRGKIFKDVRPVGVTGLIKSDHVIIGYRDNKKSGQLEAVSIRVLEHDLPIPA
jgi:hypothetical protein